MRKWRIEDSAELYNIHGWGRKYFSINEKGNVVVTPREGYASVDLREVMDGLQVRILLRPCCCVSLTFSTTVWRRFQNVSLWLPSSTITKRRITLFIPSR